MHANVMNLHAFDFVFELILPQPHSPNTFSHRHASSNTHSHSHPPRTHFLTAPFPEHIFSQPPLADHTFVFMHDRMHANVMNLYAFDFVFELILPQPYNSFDLMTAPYT